MNSNNQPTQRSAASHQPLLTDLYDDEQLDALIRCYGHTDGNILENHRRSIPAPQQVPATISNQATTNGAPYGGAANNVRRENQPQWQGNVVPVLRTAYRGVPPRLDNPQAGPSSDPNREQRVRAPAANDVLQHDHSDAADIGRSLARFSLEQTGEQRVQAPPANDVLEEEVSDDTDVDDSWTRIKPAVLRRRAKKHKGPRKEYKEDYWYVPDWCTPSPWFQQPCRNR